MQHDFRTMSEIEFFQFFRRISVKTFAIAGSVACAECRKSAAPLSVPRRVKPICFNYSINAFITCFKGRPARPADKGIWRYVGAMLALVVALGRFLAAFYVLAAFVFGSGRFFCILERSTVDFGGLKDAPGRAPTAYFSKFFHASACSRAGGAQKLLMCKNHSFSQVFPMF